MCLCVCVNDLPVNRFSEEIKLRIAHQHRVHFINECNAYNCNDERRIAVRTQNSIAILCVNYEEFVFSMRTRIKMDPQRKEK